MQRKLNIKADIITAKETYNALFSTLELTTLKIPSIFVSSDDDQKKQIYIAFQRILNAVAVEYLLPLFLGLLGANVYVLRDMSIDIQNELFLPERTVNYRLRLYLGMIAGLTFAWLFIWLIPSVEEVRIRSRISSSCGLSSRLQR
uniref:Uncharacterized protein n=1 Tax=Candidatus Kentrum sp. LPFa TaxID=2126335 RepID=A0A450X2I4_9GAMM|nr:MAG: hypothetical protein BECKLPF1236A_GA0070988_103823 [Candidatus Kentron sp. LPFa]VFK35487.1 MAG: hypothetical protein BECKLPF1236C_GA0070990_103813 [Candidatus Kentron sp. LPFa]